MYYEGGQGWPSLVTDDLVRHVDKVVRERRKFTISELSLEFPQVCGTVLYEIVTKKKWLPQVLCQMYAKNSH